MTKNENFMNKVLHRNEQKNYKKNNQFIIKQY